MKSFCKKQNRIFFLLCLLVCRLFCFGMSGIKASADEAVEPEFNASYILTAVSDGEKEGVAGLFVAASDGVKLEFDLLKGIESGHFGVAYGVGNAFGDLTGDYFGVSKAGSAISSSDKMKPDESFRFLSGYRYKVEMVKKQLKISRMEYGAYKQTRYQNVYSADLSAEGTAIGIFARSAKEKSAYVLLDNITVTQADGKVIENGFNDEYASLSGVGGAYSNNSCYGALYKTPTYTVVFTDGNGKVVKIMETTEYNYAMCTDVPAVEGKVLKGWSEDTKKVMKDMTVVPVYGDPEPELPEEEIESESSSGGGCFGSAPIGVAVALPLIAFVALKKKRGE